MQWHLGFHMKKYTPESRGFDTHYGYYTGNEEFWNHTSPCWGCGNYTALDLHFATATSFMPITNESMHYSTHLFTEQLVSLVRHHPAGHPLFLYAPYEAVHGASSCFVAGKSPDCNKPDGDELQAPDAYIQAQAHIANGDRRTFAGMLGALDEGVANITVELTDRAMIQVLSILHSSDRQVSSHHTK
jgi:arylsulfatase B/arylsulfatase I/J